MRGVVAIVGRPNVGKSSLFNRIIGERLSITDDASGITRDRIYGKASWLNQEFRVIDTGGIILKDEPFSKEIRAQATLAIDEADVIVMVVDARASITDEDRDVIKILHKSTKPLIIAANKVDDGSFKDYIYDFYALGCDEVVGVSALHGVGVGDLLDKIVENLPPERKDPYDSDVIKFCLIGQPNVGKSTLSNAIVGEERTIVSNIPGTTRDAIDTMFTWHSKKFVVVDTAGIRKSGKIFERIEKYSVLRSMKAIERSDVCLLVINAEEGIIEHDKHIASYAIEEGKPIIIVVNKWDTVQDKNDISTFAKLVRAEFKFLSYAPITFVSALTKKRIFTIIPEIDKVYENSKKEIKTSILNEVIRDAVLLKAPPSYKGKRLKISFAKQTGTTPPKFTLFVNSNKLIHFSYERYLENKIRENFDFEGTPIILEYKNKNDN